MARSLIIPFLRTAGFLVAMNTMQNVARKSLGGGLSAVRRSGAPAVCQRRSYHDNIVEHYENPRNVGSLDKKNKFVGTVR